MGYFLLAVLVVFLIYKFGKSSGETGGSVQANGGMRLKYAKLLEHILEGHKEARIFIETKTYIKAGVSNYGGNTIFHIQQCPNNIVMIDLEISNNPIVGKFSLRYRFPDYMDQDKMMEEMILDIHRKMKEL